MGSAATATHSRLDSPATPAALPNVDDLYGSWDEIRHDAYAALLKQWYVLEIPLTSKAVEEAVERVVLLAQAFARDRGDCSVVMTEHLAAAVNRFVEEHSNPKSRALHALLAVAEMELASS